MQGFKSFLEKKPREKSGAHTSARYAFQANISILKILDAHETGSDYRAFFDHFDDLVIADSADNPKYIRFYQVKAKGSGNWTINTLSKIDEKAQSPRSVIGKMYQNASEFKDIVECINFVTNASFDFLLSGGKKSTPDHAVIKAHDLHEKELQKINAAIDADFPVPHEPACSGVLIFEKSNLPLKEQAIFVTGRLANFLEKMGCDQQIPIQALYRVLKEHIVARANFSDELLDINHMFENKSLCRADVDALIENATASKRFSDSWPVIRADLIAGGISGLDIIRIQNRAFDYSAKVARGEPLSSKFKAVVQQAVSSGAINFDGIGSFADALEKIQTALNGKQDVYEGNALSGALLVEVFEIIHG